MSYDFLGERLIRAVRKPHRCESCGRTIQPGLPATYATTIQDGDFFAWRSHPECRDAEADWNKRRGPWGRPYSCAEDYYWLWQAMDDAPCERAWLIANHPVAAGRLHISLEGCDYPEPARRWAL